MSECRRLGLEIHNNPQRVVSQSLANLHVPVNLLGLPVAAQQTTQDPHATHPAQLLRHTSVGCTLSLTCGEHTGLNQRSGPSTGPSEWWS